MKYDPFASNVIQGLPVELAYITSDFPSGFVPWRPDRLTSPIGGAALPRDEAHLPGAQRGQLVDAGNQRRLQGMRGCRLGHAPDAARGTHTTALAGERHEEVVAAIVTADAGKAVRKNAAFEVFAKGLLDIQRRRMVVTLAVELTGTGQLQPGLEVISDCAAQQGLLGVPGVDSTFRGGVTSA